MIINYPYRIDLVQHASVEITGGDNEDDNHQRNIGTEVEVLIERNAHTRRVSERILKLGF